MAENAENEDSGTLTIKLDPVGGTVSPSEITRTIGEKFGTLPVPLLESYSFVGWYDNQYYGVRISQDTIVSNIDTLYAHWIGDEITISIDPNGGVVGSTSVKKRIGEQYGTLTTATKDGAVFAGFQDVSSGERISNSQYITSTSPKEVKCIWIDTARIKYFLVVVTASAYGPGMIQSQTRQIEIGDEYPDDVYTDPYGGTKVSGQITETSPRIVFTHFTIPEVEITLSYVGEGTTTTLKRKYGEPFSLPDTPAEPGDYEDINYTFKQWQHFNCAVSSGTLCLLHRRTSISAAWLVKEEDQDPRLIPNGELYQYPNPVTINLVLNGVTSPEGDKVIGYVVDENTPATTGSHVFPYFYRIGYLCTGWRSEDGSLYNSVDSVISAGKRIAYADSSPIAVTVRFHNIDSTVWFSSLVSFGGQYRDRAFPDSVPDQPYGYELVGWYTLPYGGEKVEYTDIIDEYSSTHLYPHLKAKTITVVFMPQGGVVSPESKSAVVDKPFGALPVPSRDGFVFVGWALTVFTPYVFVYETTLVPGEYVRYDNTLRIYAIWQQDGGGDQGYDGPLAYSKRAHVLAFSKIDGSLIYKHGAL